MRRRAGITLRRFWHAHRGHLLIALVVVPFLAVMVRSAIGREDPRARMPSRAEVCAATDQATAQIAARYPDAPKERLRELAEEVCRRGPMPAPTSGAIPTATPSPGCHLLDGAVRRSPAQVSAPEPAEAVPFFAARSGRLPATGTPRVGGVQLPAGTRCGPFWSTDASPPDVVGLASRLAKAFPSTGLWPVLWSYPGDEPDRYVNGGGRIARIDALDAGKILGRAWRASDDPRPFPGLAAAEPAAKRLDVDPFGAVLAKSIEQETNGSLLLLVPANRPADVPAVLGTKDTIYFSDEERSAVLRSWEERYGAVLASMSPAGLELVVGAPPRDGEQIDRLAAEHLTFAPDPGFTIEDLRELLRSDRAMPATTYKPMWSFGWPD